MAQEKWPIALLTAGTQNERHSGNTASDIFSARLTRLLVAFNNFWPHLKADFHFCYNYPTVTVIGSIQANEQPCEAITWECWRG